MAVFIQLIFKVDFLENSGSEIRQVVRECSARENVQLTNVDPHVELTKIAKDKNKNCE